MAEHPGTRPGPLSLSGTAGPAACGETGMAGSLSGPVAAIRSGRIVPIVTVRQRPERSNGFLFTKRDIMRELQPAES